MVYSQSSSKRQIVSDNTPRYRTPLLMPRSAGAAHIYKKPLLSLNILYNPSALLLSLAPWPLTLPPHSLAPGLPRSIRRPFHPSSSLSSRSPFSRSSLRSRSALLAASCDLASSACKSSMLRRSLSTLSRPLETSSVSWLAILSRRASCNWRSRTVRSTLRTERREVA